MMNVFTIFNTLIFTLDFILKGFFPRNIKKTEKLRGDFFL